MVERVIENRTVSDTVLLSMTVAIELDFQRIGNDFY